jgi:hypothetical protein
MEAEVATGVVEKEYEQALVENRKKLLCLDFPYALGWYIYFICVIS